MSENLKIFVYIVDDNKSVRRALELLLLSADINVSTYETGRITNKDNKKFSNEEILSVNEEIKYVTRININN